MDWNIYENDVLINTIYASEEFVEKYCDVNGYNYEPRPEPDHDHETELTVWDELDAAYQQGVNDV